MIDDDMFVPGVDRIDGWSDWSFASFLTPAEREAAEEDCLRAMARIERSEREKPRRVRLPSA